MGNERHWQNRRHFVICQSRCYTPTCIIWLFSCFHSHLFSVTSLPIYDSRYWWNRVTLSVLCTLGVSNRMMPVCGVEQLVEEIKYVFGCVVLSLGLMAHVYSVSCCCERPRDIIGWNGCRSEALWEIAVEREAQRHRWLVLMSWKKHNVFVGLRPAVHQKHDGTS